MTTAELYHYARQGVEEELHWFWGNLSPRDRRHQRKLLRLRQHIRRWQIKHRLRKLPHTYRHDDLCLLTYNRMVRDCYARDRDYARGINYLRNNPSKPLPLP